jgi:hypothetical protein
LFTAVATADGAAVVVEAIDRGSRRVVRRKRSRNTNRCASNQERKRRVMAKLNRNKRRDNEEKWKRVSEKR